MSHLDPVTLSRLQFAVTAMYHFLFVPLTLGLSFLLAIMESVYVMTGRQIWRDMTRFWGTLFGINFAMGVATGITMEFQFGTNWAYYSHYVGDIFGAPLAIEGLMAFFLEATFVGLFFFGWDRLPQARPPHRDLAGRARLQSLGAVDPDRQWLDAESGRRRASIPTPCAWSSTSSGDVIFNPVAQAKFVHTVGAGYVTGSMFVLAIASYYLLAGRYPGVRQALDRRRLGLRARRRAVRRRARRRERLHATENQKMKLAAIEGMWQTEPAPAGFNLFGIPDPARRTSRLRDQDSLGARHHRHALVRPAECPASTIWSRTRRRASATGLSPTTRSQRLQAEPRRRQARAHDLREHAADLGYALLLKRYVADPRKPTTRPSPRPPPTPFPTSAAVLELPHHGGARLLLHRVLRAVVLGRRRIAISRADGCCGWRSGRCRCRGSPPNSAGSSPNTAASRGRSTACCRRFSPRRRCRPRR